MSACPECLCGAGTKRPHQYFFCPLKLEGHAAVPCAGPLLRYQSSGLAFPLHLELQKAAGPVGGIGLWNQYEFLKLVLAAGDQHDSTWLVKELVWEQTSMAKHHVTDWAEVSQPVQAKATKAHVQKAADIAAEYDMFDCPFMTSAAAGPAPKGKEQAKESDSELEDVNDADLADHGLHDMLELLGIQAQEQLEETGEPKEAPAPRKVASGQVKTVATDPVLVMRALGRRPEQPKVFVLCSSQHKVHGSRYMGHGVHKLYKLYK